MLIQAGDDQAGIAALREAVRISPDYADAHANLGAALTPTDAEEAIRELEKAVALAPASVKAQFNLAVAYGASPRRRIGEGDRAAAKGDRARADVRAGPPGAWQGACFGTARCPTRSRRCRRLRGWSRRAAKPTISLVWPWRARDARRRPQLSSRRAASSWPPTIATRTRNLDIAEGRAALERGDLERGGRQVPACDPAPARTRPKRRAVPRRWSWRSKADSRTPGRPRHGGGGARRLHSRGQVHGGRAAPRRVREAASEVVLGLVRARLQPVRPAEDRRVHQGAGEVSRARHPKRRGSQDPRPQPDDHRAIRRGAGRVRAGASATSRTPPRSTTTSASCFRFRTTGSPRGRRSRRRFGSIRRTSRRWTPSGSRWRRWATTPARSRKYEKAIAPERRAAGQLRLRPREPERLLQPHGRSGQGARARAQGARARSRSPTARGFRRGGRTSARGDSTRRSMR